MMIRTAMTFISFFGVYAAIAQSNEARLDSFSTVYTHSLQQGDFDQLLSLTHPGVIKLSGGMDYARQDLERDAQEYNRMQLRLTSIETKTSSKIIESGDELHAIVPYEKLYENEGIKHEESNYYLAASIDNGETWTFLDLRKYDIESIKLFIPAYDGRLDVFLEQ